MSCNRREFLGLATAFGAVGVKNVKGAENRLKVEGGRLNNGGLTSNSAVQPPQPSPLSQPKLKVGIVSDIHICTMEKGRRDSHEYFLKALRYFDSQKVDAVLVPGDMFTSGRIEHLEIVAKTWGMVFPNNTAADGRHVEPLFITGNHDIEDWAYHLENGETIEQKAARIKKDFFAFNRQETWKRLFGEDYAPYYAKTVKGYTFVLRNWPSYFQKEKPAVREAMAEWGPKVKNDKVFFYCQHDQPDDTVNAPWLIGGEKWSNGQDNGTTTKVLSAYPNCVCLTGHNHHSLADERSIWQGAFTAVNCGCLVGWAFAEQGRENGHDCDPNPLPVREMPTFSHTQVRQGLVMTVYEDCIRFHRLEFVNGGVLGPDWIVPLNHRNRPYAIAPRAAASKPPRFSPQAKVTVQQIAEGRDRTGNEHPQVEVAFPSVTSMTGGDRAHDYSVRMEMRIGDIIRVVDEKRVFSDRFMWAEKDDLNPVKCRFAKSAIPKGRKVRFTVTPYNCWLKAGSPISGEWNVLS